MGKPFYKFSLTLFVQFLRKFSVLNCIAYSQTKEVYVTLLHVAVAD